MGGGGGTAGLLSTVPAAAGSTSAAAAPPFMPTGSAVVEAFLHRAAENALQNHDTVTASFLAERLVATVRGAGGTSTGGLQAADLVFRNDGADKVAFRVRICRRLPLFSFTSSCHRPFKELLKSKTQTTGKKLAKETKPKKKKTNKQIRRLLWRTTPRRCCWPAATCKRASTTARTRCSRAASRPTTDSSSPCAGQSARQSVCLSRWWDE